MGVNLNANSAWAALMANAQKPKAKPVQAAKVEIIVRAPEPETAITALDHQKFAVIVDQLRKRLRIKLQTANYAKCTRSWIEFALLTRAVDTKCGNQNVTREYIQLMQITAREAALQANVNPALIRQRIHPIN